MNKHSTILLMDADPEVLEQLQTVLLREGYEVMVAADGNAALRRAQQQKPDLIVSDLLLAGMDGYQVWKTLRAKETYASIPLLIVSALAIPASNEPWRPNPNIEWQLLSYDAFLPKPVDLRRFVRVTQKLLDPSKTAAIPGGPSVIVAIEDKELQNQMTAILSCKDFGVESPASLAEALQLAKASPPAAIIFDCRLPNVDVKSVIQQTKRYIPSIIILFIVDRTKEIEADLETLGNGFLSMPLHPVLTIKAINRVLNQVDAQRRNQTISDQLISINQELLDIQQVLHAQNQELEHSNAQLRELGNLKETLTSMVVHDLKAPLGSVLGAIDFLITDPDLDLSSTHARLLTAAIAAGSQLLRLTETLLEGQRLEEGRIKPDLEPVDLLALIDVSLHEVSPLLTMHQLKIEYAPSRDFPFAYADAHMSQRILENLLDNAIKFSPVEGVITIKISAVEPMITISITDQGPGIPLDRQAEIFDRFAQIKNAAVPTTRAGFGLGLTFCHLATQAMGGSIWVESDGESGTTFLFNLPIYHDKT